MRKEFERFLRSEGERPRRTNRSPAVRPSDDDATLRAAIERVVISRAQRIVGPPTETGP